MKFRPLCFNYKSSANEVLETERTNKFMDRIPQHHSISTSTIKKLNRIEIMERLGCVKYQTEFILRPIHNKDYALRQHEKNIEMSSNEYIKNIFTQQFKTNNNDIGYDKIKFMDIRSSDHSSDNEISDAVVPGAMFQKTIEILVLHNNNDTKTFKDKIESNNSISNSIPSPSHEQIWMINNKIWSSMDVIPSKYMQQQTINSVDLFNFDDSTKTAVKDRNKTKMITPVKEKDDIKKQQNKSNENYNQMKISMAIVSKLSKKHFSVKNNENNAIANKHSFAKKSTSLISIKKNRRKNKSIINEVNNKGKNNDDKISSLKNVNDNIVNIDEFYKENLWSNSDKKNLINIIEKDRVDEKKCEGDDNTVFLMKVKKIQRKKCFFLIYYFY